MTFPLIVISGPTSVGKTGIATALAKRLDAEIVSADSRQIYQEMSIGTAKPTLEEQQGIPHHLIDFVKPDQSFTLADYVECAWKAVQGIHRKKKIPIMAGSSGLYIRAVTRGYFFPEAPPDEKLRAELEERLKKEGTSLFYEKLCQIDPEGSKSLDKNNPRRLIRFYEIYVQTGFPPSHFWKMRDPRGSELRTLQFVFTRDREKLRKRIAERVDEQEKLGLIEEVGNLLKKYPKTLKAFQTHGYQEVFPYLEGECSWEESKEKIIHHTYQYAHRQIIWHRKEKGVFWEEAEPFGDWDVIAEKISRKIKI